MNSHEVFIHIHQGCFAGTGAIIRLPQCQWSKPDGYGKISQCITTTKHNKAKTVCIFLGIYCMWQILQTLNKISSSSGFNIEMGSLWWVQNIKPTPIAEKHWMIISFPNANPHIMRMVILNWWQSCTIMAHTGIKVMHQQGKTHTCELHWHQNLCHFTSFKHFS